MKSIASCDLPMTILTDESFRVNGSKQLITTILAGWAER